MWKVNPNVHLQTQICAGKMEGLSKLLNWQNRIGKPAVAVELEGPWCSGWPQRERTLRSTTRKNAESAARAVEEAQKIWCSALALQADVSLAEQAEQLVSETIDALGGIGHSR